MPRAQRFPTRSDPSKGKGSRHARWGISQGGAYKDVCHRRLESGDDRRHRRKARLGQESAGHGRFLFIRPFERQGVRTSPAGNSSKGDGENAALGAYRHQQREKADTGHISQHRADVFAKLS